MNAEPINCRVIVTMPTACRALYRLNYAAKRDARRRAEIYALKHRVIRALCRTRAFVRAWSDYDLTCFEFCINGNTYVWHCPAELVDWDAPLSEPPADVIGRWSGLSIVSYEDREWLLWLVRRWLNQREA